MPFALPAFADPLIIWIKSDRPVLMFTYWLNARISGSDPYSYHVFNVIIHCITSGIVFLIVRRFLEWSGVDRPKRNLLARFSGALFLLHPVQSEAVAYLAGRSEALSVMFVFAAFAVFLYRREQRVGWTTALAVLVLFMTSLLSKQQTIALPGLLLLTDFWWNPGFSFKGIRENWKLYAPLALGALAGVAYFWRLLTTAASAAAGLRHEGPHLVSIFIYRVPRSFRLSSRVCFARRPHRGLGFSHLPKPFWIAAPCFWIGRASRAGRRRLRHYRRRYPLVSFGFFAFLIMMAPTSSILPIRDPIAERRLYFGILGLLLDLAAGNLLSRVKMARATLAAALAAVCVLIALLAVRDALPRRSLVQRRFAMAGYGGKIAGQIARPLPTWQRHTATNAGTMSRGSRRIR